MEIPLLFLEQMKQLLGKDYSSYLDSFEEKRGYGLRVNTNKISIEDFEHISPFKLQKIPWISNGFYYDEAEKPAKHPYYYAGLYYLQEPSAMTPAEFLPIVSGDRVLDLCAAPGGKSTQLGVKLKGQGLLVANDISNSRAKALLKNLELFGIPNILVTSEPPERLSTYFPEYFDKILIDAPCSGEGMFRKDPSMIKDWLKQGPDYYASIQRQIVTEAVHMLKSGGLLLYSTCTFSPLENEGTIQYLLDTFSDLCLLPLPILEGFSEGMPEAAGGDNTLKNCVRLFPHKIKGEGHFMALLQKRGEDAKSHYKSEQSKQVSFDKIKDFKELTDTLNLEASSMDVRNQMVYSLPNDLTNIKGLRFLRTGLLLGEIKKERFEPSQALAMVLNRAKFSNVIDFEGTDQRVIRYLRGETLALTEHEKGTDGWCLICVDGFPLGFAKQNGCAVKNKYYPGWRWQ